MKKILKHGFTIIELLMVMVVLSVVVGMVVLNFPAGQMRARDTERRNNIKQYQIALESFANNNSGLYPVQDAVGNLCARCGNLNLGGCGDSTCPTGDPAYRYVTDTGGSVYVMWAELEAPPLGGGTDYFIVCSNGVSGDDTTEPTTSTCPL